MKRPLLFETDEYGYIEDERVGWFNEFRDLSQETMTYIALIVDYNSPYFSQPELRRRTLASAKILSDKGVEIQHTDALEKSISMYNDIQYDHLVEQLKSQKNILDVFTQGLNEISKMGTNKQDVERIIKATEQQQRAEKEIERLEEKVRNRMIEDSKTRGDRVTNFYEVWRKQNNVTELAQKGIENYLKAAKQRG